MSPRPASDRAPSPRRTSGRWWSRSRGLPPETYASWRASVEARPGGPVRILAWARSEDGFCVGSPALLSTGDDAGWSHLGWHTIEHGGWNAENRALTWTEYGGRRGSVTLYEPGRVPELFRERVAASIAVERFVALTGDKGVTVTARRDLARPSALSWHTSLTRGLTWTTPGVSEAADAVTAELRAEYGEGQIGC